MKAQKSNFTAYSSLTRDDEIPRTTNILELIKKQKIEQKREKMLKIYMLSGFFALILVFGIFIYL